MKVEIIKGKDGKPAVRTTDLTGYERTVPCRDMDQAMTYAQGFEDAYKAAKSVLANFQNWRTTPDIIAMNSAEPDTRAAAYELEARRAGWQCDDAGIYHDSREGNNTDDPVEYAETWEEACEISGIHPDI